MLLILSLTVASVIPASDTLLGSRMYYDCVSDLEHHYYYLREDSMLLLSGQAEQWRRPAGHNGIWINTGKTVVFSDWKSVERKYTLEKIGSLRYLIPDTLETVKTATMLKACIRQKWKTEFGTMTLKDSAAIDRLEFDFATDCSCRQRILVEVPTAYRFYYESEREFRNFVVRKKKSKKKKRH